MPGFDEAYPALREWVTRHGWIEVGPIEGFSSMIQVLNEGRVGAEISGRPVPAPAWHDVRAMLEYLSLLIDLCRGLLRSRGDLVAENLLLRQQLAVLTRPTRQRPRPRTRD